MKMIKKFIIKKKNPIINFCPHITISLFHHYLMVFRFAITIFGKQIGMHINQFEFIFLSIMDEFHPIIYLFNPNHK
jgi:hypothetical protein